MDSLPLVKIRCTTKLTPEMERFLKKCGMGGREFWDYDYGQRHINLPKRLGVGPEMANFIAKSAKVGISLPAAIVAAIKQHGSPALPELLYAWKRITQGDSSSDLHLLVELVMNCLFSIDGAARHAECPCGQTLRNTTLIPQHFNLLLDFDKLEKIRHTVNDIENVFEENELFGASAQQRVLGASFYCPHRTVVDRRPMEWTEERPQMLFLPREQRMMFEALVSSHLSCEIAVRTATDDYRVVSSAGSEPLVIAGSLRDQQAVPIASLIETRECIASNGQALLNRMSLKHFALFGNASSDDDDNHDFRSTIDTCTDQYRVKFQFDNSSVFYAVLAIRQFLAPMRITRDSIAAMRPDIPERFANVIRKINEVITDGMFTIVQ